MVSKLGSSLYEDFSYDSTPPAEDSSDESTPPSSPSKDFSDDSSPYEVFSDRFHAEFVRHGFDYDFATIFDNFSFRYRNKGTHIFCILEPDEEVKKETLLMTDAVRITKICISPCRVINPFLSENEMQTFNPKDKRLAHIKVETDCDKEYKTTTTMTLKVHQIWWEKICQPKKGVPITIKMIDKYDKDYKPCEFVIQKIDPMDDEVYKKFEHMHCSVFLPNQLKFGKIELVEFGSDSRWIKSIENSKLQKTEELLDAKLEEAEQRKEFGKMVKGVHKIVKESWETVDLSVRDGYKRRNDKEEDGCVIA